MGTFLAVVALIAAAGAFFYAWISRQELERANRRLDRYNRALFDANDEIRRLSEAQAEHFAQLRAEVARLSGKASFSPAMTLREVYALHPQAQEVLAGYHVGGCSSCAVELDDSLEKVCNASGIDTAQLMMNLNALLGANGHHHAPVEIQRVKLPNIELSL
jgi:hypothetical protein